MAPRHHCQHSASAMALKAKKKEETGKEESAGSPYVRRYIKLFIWFDLSHRKGSNQLAQLVRTCSIPFIASISPFLFARSLPSP
jgi:hypothetical protein